MIQEVEIENNLAENEIYCNGFTYTKCKPNEEDIEQLRFIKQLRKEQLLKEPEVEDNVYVKEIKDKLNVIPKERGYNRIKTMNEITETFMDLLKWSNKEDFKRGDLRDLFPDTEDKNKKREMQRIIKEILKFLDKKGMIKKEKSPEHCYTYENRYLYSQDYGSFYLLMKRNGYKYNEETECWTSTIPQKRQGCFSNGNKSVFRKRLDYQTERYILI